MEKVLYKFDFWSGMEWFYWALFSSALYALNNTMTKYTVDKHIRDPIAFIMLIGAMDSFLAAYSYLFKGVVFGFTLLHLASFAQGPAFFIGRICFLEAIKHDEVSRLMTLSASGPLVVAVLAYALLGEAFPPHIYLGIFIVVLGSGLIAYRKVRKPEHGRSVKFTLLSVLFLSIGSVLSKYASPLGFWYLVFGGTFSYVCCTLLLFIYPRTRKAFKKAIWLRKHYALAAAIYLLITIGWFAFIRAFTLGPISLVATVAATASLFTLAYTSVLSHFWPRILKEEIDRKTLGQKLLAALLMIFGVYLLT